MSYREKNLMSNVIPTEQLEVYGYHVGLIRSLLHCQIKYKYFIVVCICMLHLL